MDYFDYKTDSQLEPEFNPDSFDVEEFLKRSQEREQRRIEKQLEEVEQELEERNQLHEELVSELEKKLDWYLERLKTLYQRPGSSESGDKNELKSRIKEFYREIRDEKQSHWRDRQELEMEKREICRELEELSSENKIMELL